MAGVDASHARSPSRIHHRTHVTVLDPDGYRLTFTAPQAKELEGRGESFDALMARMRERLP